MLDLVIGYRQFVDDSRTQQAKEIEPVRSQGFERGAPAVTKSA
jgi:hypothetical protein